eukprot:s37_g45.t1
MNEQVFGTLTAAGAVRRPSEDLLMRIETLGWRVQAVKPGLSQAEHPDAFFHETDCLDYCNEYVVQNFSYDVAVPTLPLESYMREYRAVIRNQMPRLSENAFERMNDLPAGVLNQLRQFCEVRLDEPAGRNLSDELPNMSRAMCFIFKGALSLVKIVPMVEKPDKLESHQSFSFRRGKRLLSRYPPGHVAGIEMFFKFHKQRVDEDLQPKLILAGGYDPKRRARIVSSLLGPPAEIWILRYDGWQDVPGWKQMPDGLKGYLARMLCVQFADTLKHANLKERYDMPALLADAFPGVRNYLDASSFLFTGGTDVATESWSLPVLWPGRLGAPQEGIQGQWQDAVEDLLYVVDGTDVHITQQCDGRAASIVLTEHSKKDGAYTDSVWLQNTWYLDMPAVGKARETGELRWIPADIQDKPRAKPFLDEARDYLESPQLLHAFRSVSNVTADRLPQELAKTGGKASALKEGTVPLATLFGGCITLGKSLFQADPDGTESAEASIRAFADQTVVSQFCEALYFQEAMKK